MFTGIIEAVGTVEAIETCGDLFRLRVAAPTLSGEVELGDSVAVNGACLTVTAAGSGSVAFDAVQETLLRTALGALAPGSRVNLERALRAGGRLDGHIVQGHVDATGVVEALEREGSAAEDVRLAVTCGPDFMQWLVEKGSVAIDGVSLTVAGLRESGFDVALIPHTLVATNLGDRRAGERVNLEGDVLGKYVKRHLERLLGTAKA